MSAVVVYLDRDPIRARRNEFYRVAHKIAIKKNAKLIAAHSGYQIMRGVAALRDESVSHLIFICHGGTQWLLDSSRGVHASRTPPPHMVSVYSLAHVLKPKLTHSHLISLGSCLCSRSPHWYLNRYYGRALSPWGEVSYKDGGRHSFSGRLRDALVIEGVHPTIRGHTAAGHCTALPLLREHAPLIHDDGGSLFQRVLGEQTEPTLLNRRRWVKMVRGQLAERLLLFDPFAELEIFEQWKNKYSSSR